MGEKRLGNGASWGTKRRSRAETRWKRSRSGRRRPGTDPPRASRASGDGRGVGSRGGGRGRWAREARARRATRAASRDSRATSPRLDAQKQAKGTKGSPEPSRSPRETDGPRGVGAGGNGRTRGGGRTVDVGVRHLAALVPERVPVLRRAHGGRQQRPAVALPARRHARAKAVCVARDAASNGKNERRGAGADAGSRATLPALRVRTARGQRSTRGGARARRARGRGTERGGDRARETDAHLPFARASVLEFPSRAPPDPRRCALLSNYRARTDERAPPTLLRSPKIPARAEGSPSRRRPDSLAVREAPAACDANRKQRTRFFVSLRNGKVRPPTCFHSHIVCSSSQTADRRES